MHIQRYLLSLPSPFFIPTINPCKPEIIPWTLCPHSPAECPCGQRETLRTALMRRSKRVRHIRVVTVYVTWHVLWCKQWTLTTGIMVVVTTGVKPAHLEFGDSTMGPVLWEFHFFWSFSQWQRPENFYLCCNYRDNEPYFSLFLFSESLQYWNVHER